MTEFELALRQPSWMAEVLRDVSDEVFDRSSAMSLAIELSRRNVANGTGGPFGAVVLDRSRHRIVSLGVNSVVALRCSLAHAEMMAVSFAQQVLGTFDLGAPGMPPHDLVTSCEPCAMCFGAVPWSGVRGLVCGARDEDAREIGFDEGPKLERWVYALEQRGIEVVRDVHRPAAKRVLEDYAIGGGPIYNSRGDELLAAEG